MYKNTLLVFLKSYLNIEPRIRNALRKFYNIEGPDALNKLKNEIKSLLVSDVSETEMRKMFEEAGNYFVNSDITSAKQLMLEMFEFIPVLAPSYSYEKIYDVFISYSSKDKNIAEKMALELKDRGYNVWFDKWEILTGYNIAEEVYKTIRLSKFILVILTKYSCQSSWVKEELTHAKLQEIEGQQVKMFSVLIEKCKIPDSLKSIQCVDFTSWNEGMRNLLASLQAYTLEKKFKVDEEYYLYKDYKFDHVTEFYTKNLNEIIKFGWRKNEGFKDVLIGPPDNVNINIKKHQILSIIDDCRIRLQRWGGAPFPYEIYPRTKEDRLSDGVRIYDNEKWPFSNWSFNFWMMNQHSYFFHRTDLTEDHIIDDNDQLYGENTLYVSWVIKDICTPIMFAQRLIRRVKISHPLKVSFRWSKMKNRRLKIVRDRRLPLLAEYICSTEKIEEDTIVSGGSNLMNLTFKIVKNIFWHFEWDNFSEEIIKNDISSFLSGIFPD